MKFKEICTFIISDLYRYTGDDNIKLKRILGNYLFNPSFKFSFWLRMGRSKNKLIRLISKMQHKRYSIKYMIDIPISTSIGYGLYLGHGQCIVINKTTIIGNNVNISQFTTIGSNHDAAAIIGNNVYIGPAVCIVENVNIGSNVKIGAGAVVTKDIINNSTAVGVPAKIIHSNNVINDYIKNPWAVKKQKEVHDSHIK